MSVYSETTQSRFTSRDDLLSTFDGDVEFVRELVLTFLDRVPFLMEAIESGLNTGDGAAVSHAAHELKGVLGYFDQGLNLANTLQIERITPANLADGRDLLLRLRAGLGPLELYLAEEFVGGQTSAARNLGPVN